MCVGYIVGCPMVLRKETFLYLKVRLEQESPWVRIESPQVTWEFLVAPIGPFLEGSRKEWQLCEERLITSPTKIQPELRPHLFSPQLHPVLTWVVHASVSCPIGELCTYKERCFPHGVFKAVQIYW